MNFGQRLEAAFRTHGHLCVGIDPHPYLLDTWGLPRSAAGVRTFGLSVVAAAASSRAGIVKPQVAFFEAYGSAGFAALEEVLSTARGAGLLVIGDAKRGDIGSTNDGYADAWLDAGAPFEVDAVTVTAYTGVGALSGLLDRAEQSEKGVFVLSATSNPESRVLQTARTEAGATVSQLISREVAERNGAADAGPGAVGASGLGASGLGASGLGTAGLGDIGLVLGATKRLEDYGFSSDTRALLATTPVLAPGFGFQGARFDEIPAVFGPLAANTVVSVSRSILQHGADGILAAIDEEAAALAEVLT